MVFVDFQKAFDSINRKAMLHILLNYGVPPQFVQAIAYLYDNPKSFVQTLDGPTKAFLTTAGILQGDTLAPFLFVIVVDYILRQSADQMKEKGLYIGRRSGRQSSNYLTDLDYADDIALTANLISSAQDLLLSLEIASEKVGLKLNTKKTKCLHLNQDLNQAQSIFSKTGAPIKQVEDFKYLGSFIGDSKRDFLTRKGLAWKACNKLNKIWKSDISTKTKISFFRACVESILLYGSETWTMKAELKQRLDGTYTRLLMKVKNLNWRNHPNKALIYGELPPISTTLAQRRSMFAGHCFRAKDQVVSDVLLWRLPQANRGARKLCYPDTICRDTNLTLEELKESMMNRETWKLVTSAISTAVEG